MTIIRQVRTLAQWMTARMDVKSQKGATAVEYGLMIALIAAVIIAAVVVLGNNAKTQFQCTATSISTKANNC